MTNSPWVGRAPQVQSEHTVSTEEFASLVESLSEVLNGRACCPQHAAIASVTAAAAALHALHGDKLDTIDRELQNVCNLVMNNFRSGLFRPDVARMGA
ncbi:MAG TPA: hypothetical protein VGD45_20510 [Steroidobacter sp.]|uniref:hypothetical protein n=1 Tax=Steroidobacter sp. TaxID=1978227 RepID=UPI002EDAF493